VLLAVIATGGCGGGAAAASDTPAGAHSAGEQRALLELGRRIFFDRSLSASGRLACASCHSATHAYGPPDALAVQRGGAALDRQGVRAVPSLRYVLNRTPVWFKEYIDNPAERLREGNEPPSGGFGWDGRFNSLQEQASFPLLSPDEMANATPAEVVRKLARAAYASEFRQAFGAHIFEDPPQAYARALDALERFELDDPSFHPFTSKFDRYLDGRESLTAQEKRGLTLFDDPERGNCAACHTDRTGADGSHPLFTDYQFEALGVPRNPEIHANARRDYFDEGACGPLRRDPTLPPTDCGLFKTPGLRNVASRRVFFHNGRFHSLREALRFYAQRDTQPQRWYPRDHHGQLIKFDDLPPGLRGNVDVIDRPLTRHRGERPVWSEAEIDDVMAFLRTLDDADVSAIDGSGR
jgi:cytochrome c peroxidase